MRTRRKVVVTIVGAAAFLVVALLAAGYWMLSSLMKVESFDSARATEMLSEIRGRFEGVEPAFDIQGGSVTMVRQPPETAATEAITTYALAWRKAEGTISRATIPISILALTTEPVPLDRFMTLLETDLAVSGLEIRARDIQRYGPTLLLDAVTPEGDVVLIWNE
jgi:hypothetical protein